MVENLESPHLEKRLIFALESPNNTAGVIVYLPNL